MIVWVFSVFLSSFQRSGLTVMSLLWPPGVDCGTPPPLPNTHMLWNKNSRIGAVVLYRCISGYHNVGKGNVSVCTAAGQWENSSILCQGTITYLSVLFTTICPLFPPCIHTERMCYLIATMCYSCRDLVRESSCPRIDRAGLGQCFVPWQHRALLL